MRDVKVKRGYKDGCAAAHGLALIGERWALLVVRELILGPKRFTDLRAALPGISPNVLTQRLEELERTSIVKRRKLAPPAAAWVYELTEWGMELEPVVMALGRWAARSPFLPQGRLSVDSLILSFGTMFAGEAFTATIELRIGEERFRAVVNRGRMELLRGSASEPDVIIEGDTAAFAEVVYGGGPKSRLSISGDKAVAKRFLGSFPLPSQAPTS